MRDEAAQLTLTEEWTSFDSPEVSKLGWGMRLGFRLAGAFGAFSAVRRAHRIVVFSF